MTQIQTVVRTLNARKSGNDWSAKCPAHDDHVASLSIGEGRDGRILLNCHAGCDVKRVAAAAGMEIVDLMGEELRLSFSVRDDVCYDYVDEDRVLLFQVVKTLLPDGKKKFAQRRPLPNGDWAWGLEDVRRVLYRLPELVLADHEAPVLIPEGEKDVETLRRRGFVATTNLGGAGKGKWRAEFSESLRGRHCILLPDNDEVGRAHMQSVAAALSGIAASVRIVEIPNLPEKGDVTDFFDNGGTVDELRAILFPPKTSLLVSVSELANLIERYYAEGVPRGLSTGWPSLDEFFTVRKGEFTVVTGIPGHGKTSWLDAMLVNLASLHGYKCGLFSAENLPIERHASGLAEKYAGKYFGRPGDGFRMTPQQLAEATRFLSRHFRFIRPSEDGQNLESIFEAMREFVDEGMDAIVIDPWNEIDHAIPNGMSETDYVDQSLRRLRRFARFHVVKLFVVVHPAKLRRETSGNYPVPTLYDCHGSAHWRNKADNGIVVWRDVLDEKAGTSIYVQKIRFREIGKIGTCTLHYQSMSGRYEDRKARTEERFA